MVFWGLLIFLLLGLILLRGLKDKDFKYMKLEFDLKKSTRIYVKKNKLTPNIARSIIIDVDDLIKSKYISEEDASKYCIKDIVYSKRILFDKMRVERICND